VLGEKPSAQPDSQDEQRHRTEPDARHAPLPFPRPGTSIDRFPGI
jgi:hypothetical protein